MGIIVRPGLTIDTLPGPYGPRGHRWHCELDRDRLCTEATKCEICDELHAVEAKVDRLKAHIAHEKWQSLTDEERKTILDRVGCYGPVGPS